MKIVARVEGEKPTLIEALKAGGIAAKLVRNATIVELERNQSHTDLYHVPDEIQSHEYVLLIEATEHGGGMTNTGSATVVCGSSGKKLRPYYVPKGHSNSTHAYFSVPGSIITVTGYRKDDNVTIMEHKIEIKGAYGEFAEIKTSDVWSGEVGVLPNLYSRYQDAAEAAHGKANCYHCRHVHYAEV